MKFSALRSAVRAELGVTVYPIEGAHGRPHIYLTINTATLGQPGKACFYVGKHVGRDARYLGSGKHLQAAVRKYGTGAFQRVLLTLALDYDDKASGEHCEYEQRYLDRWRAADNPRFYNLSDSSGGGGENARKGAAALATLSPEQRREIGRKGALALNAALSPEQRQEYALRANAASQAARTPESEAYRLERLSAALVLRAALSPEQLRASAAKARAALAAKRALANGGAR